MYGQSLPATCLTNETPSQQREIYENCLASSNLKTMRIFPTNFTILKIEKVTEQI